MTPRRIVAAVAACLAALTVGWLARPARYEVDGLSMAPGLLPGDIVTSDVFPSADVLRQPRRFDRWIISTPEGGIALKRLVGLPGETVSIADGDLSIDGRICLKSPRVLAETAVEVPQPIAPQDPKHVRFDAAEVLDDVDFATEVNRSLLPVRDVGIAATVRSAATDTHVCIRVGDTRITWRLEPHQRGCFVAGRLDGHLVATGWRLHAAPTAAARGRLPAAAADSWTHAKPWPIHGALDTNAPAIAVDVEGDAAVVERLTRWRDILYRPAADGTTEWRIPRDGYFVLGDFPTVSRDSRHWGPLHRTALVHRVHEVVVTGSLEARSASDG
ncbi:MAG: S26 family signal peptidase [Planctomycetia bacterium]|nr:S26 family signal peptidase [Planctomycetia bacterium]